ncbi:MAG: sigma-70 family RNA polymerase sigma factor [Deltaproteobacteria bacterium]|nr:sigma-70 family RNA polymerase sigma factor [Deltaproteobacteria bacterium]
MDDWELLETWRGGDGGAGDVLLGRYFDLLTRFFSNKVSNREDVADLISETMLACTRGKHNLREAAAFRAFLMGSAMNVLRLHFRKKAKRGREQDDFAKICVGDSDDPRSVTSMVSLKDEGRLLVRALRRLPLNYQIVLELNYIEDLNGPEIAELLGIPRKTVYTRLRRSKERLREVMAQLSTSPELVESTLVGLRTWAGHLRDEIAR